MASEKLGLVEGWRVSVTSADGWLLKIGAARPTEGNGENDDA